MRGKYFLSKLIYECLQTLNIKTTEKLREFIGKPNMERFLFFAHVQFESILRCVFRSFLAIDRGVGQFV